MLRIARIPICALGLLLMVSCGADQRVPRLSVPLPFGAVDSLGETQADGTLRLSGWVLSEDPVLTVALYIDGRYVTTALLHQPRPDVNRAYPAFGPVNPGWRIDIDPALFPGDHEVLVQARTRHGAVRDLRAARVTLGGGAKVQPL
jgi:hypothetical protein